jgi:hypothetical protein
MREMTMSWQGVAKKDLLDEDSKQSERAGFFDPSCIGNV